MRWAGRVARLGEKKNAYRIFVESQKERDQLGRPGRRWEYNIKMDLMERGWGGMDWIDSE
jgi:hypothetical protein